MIHNVSTQKFRKLTLSSTPSFSTVLHKTFPMKEECVGKENPYVFTIIHFISQIGTCIALFVALTSKTSIELF